MQILLRSEDVVKATGLCRATIYTLIKEDPEFPKPIKVGKRSARWLENEIQAWQQARIESRDKVAA